MGIRRTDLETKFTSSASLGQLPFTHLHHSFKVVCVCYELFFLNYQCLLDALEPMQANILTESLLLMVLETIQQRKKLSGHRFCLLNGFFAWDFRISNVSWMLANIMRLDPFLLLLEMRQKAWWWSPWVGGLSSWPLVITALHLDEDEDGFTLWVTLISFMIALICHVTFKLMLHRFLRNFIDKCWGRFLFCDCNGGYFGDPMMMVYHVVSIWLKSIL
jgi:hypothetical protein